MGVFNDWFDAELRRSSWSIYDFAREAGTSPSNAQSWRMGPTTPEVKNLALIASAFGMTLDAIFAIAHGDVTGAETEPQEFSPEEAGWVRILRETHPGVRSALLEAAQLAPPPRQDEDESDSPPGDSDQAAGSG